MTPEFRRALPRTVRIEGGYVDHPADRGGPTNLGITLPALRAWYAARGMSSPNVDDLRALTHDDAAQLYFDLYWSDRHLPCQALAEWWQVIGAMSFDLSVHSGQVMSACLLQRALNLVNLDEKAWPDIEVDSWVGAKTLALLPEVDKLPRGRERLHLAYHFQRGKLLIEIAERDHTQEAFIAGWLFRIAQNEAEGWK